VAYIGPSLPEKHVPLTPELEEFLTVRKRVVYIGFGSRVIVLPAWFEAMIESLSTAYHFGLLDGVIWGLMYTKASELPEVIHTNTTNALGESINEEHHMEDMYTGKHPFIRIVDVAPQRAVLKHPSVKLFISHCGMGSIHEAFEGATPLLGIPVYGDQPSNAMRIEAMGAGINMKWYQVGTDAMHSAFKQLLEGESAERVRTVMTKLQRMTVLFNRRIPYAADMVEMAAIPGAIKFLETADKRMAWWRARNADVWATVVLALFIVTAGSIYATVKTVGWLKPVFKQTPSKIKRA
jgi:hypothetical protein